MFILLLWSHTFPAGKCLKGIHPAEQHSSILGIFLGLRSFGSAACRSSSI